MQTSSTKTAETRRHARAMPPLLPKGESARANEAFRHKLREVFFSKVQRNPTYSLRAFAAFLKVDQSFLSKVLRGQKRFSMQAIEELAPKLGFSPLELHRITEDSARAEFVLLEDDHFQAVSEWYHFAILELFKTSPRVRDAEKLPLWVSKRLGIHIEEARAALARLERLGMIRNSLPTDHSWSKIQGTSEARKKLQRQFLEKSLLALDEVEFDLRDHGSLTVAVNPKRLPEFKKKLIEVRRELNAFFQADPDLKEVYQLTLSLFPLSQLKSAKRSSPPFGSRKAR